MRQVVHCTITTIDTDLSCTLLIGHRDFSDDMKGNSKDWKKTGGRLHIGWSEGTWFYFAPPPKREKEGIVLFKLKETGKDPGNYTRYDLLVTLYDVKRDFAINTPLKSDVEGEGIFHLTNEKLHWKMRGTVYA